MTGTDTCSNSVDLRTRRFRTRSAGLQACSEASMSHSRIPFLVVVLACTASAAVAQGRFQSTDLLKLRSVGAVQVAPDGARVAYTVENNDGPGRPYGQLWVMTVADGKSVRFGSEKEASGNPQWAPDGQSIAYQGRIGDKSGLIVARPAGSG